MKKNKLVLDFRLAILTVITLAVLMPVFSVIHEMGHGALCFVNGNDFTWGLNLIGGAWLSCIGTIEDPTMFRLAGGLISALTASTVLILVLPHFSKKTGFISIALASIAATEYITALMEGFANDFYMNSGFAGAILGTVLLCVVIFFVWRNSR